jgi:polar amino acid transport system ATP-binding protein
MNQLAPETATEHKGAVKIRIEGLKKSFGDLVVLDGITTTVKEGEVVCVIGPSATSRRRE